MAAAAATPAQTSEPVASSTQETQAASLPDPQADPIQRRVEVSQAGAAAAAPTHPAAQATAATPAAATIDVEQTLRGASTTDMIGAASVQLRRRPSAVVAQAQERHETAAVSHNAWTPETALMAAQEPQRQSASAGPGAHQLATGSGGFGAAQLGGGFAQAMVSGWTSAMASVLTANCILTGGNMAVESRRLAWPIIILAHALWLMTTLTGSVSLIC